MNEKTKIKISNSLKGRQPKNSKNWKGKNHPSYGKKRSEETKEKMRKIKLGKTGYWKGKKRPPFTLEHKKKQSEALRGEKSYNWKGGQKIKRQIRDCFRYRKWRSDIFERDDWTCQTCRKRGCYLEAHHSKNKFSEIIRNNNIESIEEALNCKELWDINNGVTLCSDCHNLTK